MVGSQGPRTISYRKPHWNNKEGRRNPIILYNWLCGRGDAFLHNTTAKTTRDATSSPGMRWHKQRQTLWTHAHLTRARSRLKHPTPTGFVATQHLISPSGGAQPCHVTVL